MSRIIIPLLVLFSIVYIIHFVRWFIKNEKEKVQIYYKDKSEDYSDPLIQQAYFKNITISWDDEL